MGFKKVSSYHDLDHISTMSTLPRKKTRRIASHESPQTVTDVKVFDHAYFQDDAGGVPIDLCLPGCDDDGKEFKEQQQQPCPQQQQQQQCQRFSRPAPSCLQPVILEERRVAFAAQHVVLQGCSSIDQRYFHQVMDAVQVWFVPHHTEYTEKQRSDTWYTKAEMAAMRERAIEANNEQRRISMEQKAKAQQERVIQEHLDNCSLFASPFSVRDPTKIIANNAPETTTTMPIERSGSERRARYEFMIDAVLLEQYEQRRMCLRVYGRVEPGVSSILDPERLSTVYSIAGTTRESQTRAMEKAAQTTFRLEIDEEDKDEAPSSSSARAGSGSKKAKAPKPKRSISCSTIEVETSFCLDRGVGSIFQVLLSPFLEIRKEDLFLGVGEEMSIVI